MGKNTKRDKGIIAKYISGQTKAEIARSLDISRERVGKIVEKLGGGSIGEKFVYQDLIDLENIRLSYAKRKDLLEGLDVSVDVYRSFLFKIKKGKPIQASNKVKSIFVDVAKQIVQQSLKQIEQVEELIDTIDKRS